MLTYSFITVAQRVDLDTLADDIGQPDFHHHLHRFIQDQLESDTSTSSPFFYMPDRIYVYSSAITTFYTPSDLCGTGGMCSKHMHAVTSWRYGTPRYDCVFVNTDKQEWGMHGLSITQARLFFSVTVNHINYPCALVHWYSWLGESPDENTGMWIVEPDTLDDGSPWIAVIHLDTIIHLAHLLAIQ